MDYNAKHIDNDTMPLFFPNNTSDDENTDDTPRSDRYLNLCLIMIVRPIYLADESDNENDDSVYSFEPPMS